MSDHHGKAVLQRIRDLQRRELLQPRPASNPMKDIFDPVLSDLVEEIKRLDKALLEQAEPAAVTEAVNCAVLEIAKANAFAGSPKPDDNNDDEEEIY
jgi:hypothetical protein